MEIPGGGSEGYHVLRVSVSLRWGVLAASIPVRGAPFSPAERSDARPGVGAAALYREQSHQCQGKKTRSVSGASSLRITFAAAPRVCFSSSLVIC